MCTWNPQLIYLAIRAAQHLSTNQHMNRPSPYTTTQAHPNTQAVFKAIEEYQEQQKMLRAKAIRAAQHLSANQHMNGPSTSTAHPMTPAELETIEKYREEQQQKMLKAKDAEEEEKKKKSQEIVNQGTNDRSQDDDIVGDFQNSSGKKSKLTGVSNLVSMNSGGTDNSSAPMKYIRKAHYYCELCSVKANGVKGLEQHLEGKRHQHMVKLQEAMQSDSDAVADSDLEPKKKKLKSRSRLGIRGHSFQPSTPSPSGNQDSRFDSSESEIEVVYPVEVNDMGQSPEKTEKLLDSHTEMLEQMEETTVSLEERLKKSIVGQVEAITNIAAAIRAKEMGWCDDDHPLVFLFLGSSGVGKTELARQIAKHLHADNEDAFIKFNMFEYQGEHAVAKLFGSFPGYEYYNDGVQLTQKLKECPNAVVLFEGMDVAHPGVLNMLIKLFEEGRLTDGTGETAECKDAIFVMTSNLASDEIMYYGMQAHTEAEAKNMDTGDVTVSQSFKEEVVHPLLKRHFRNNHFLGRITEIVFFLPFSMSELLKLVHMELEHSAEMAKERGIELTWNKNALEVLSESYDVHYGARSIKHGVKRQVINQLAKLEEKQLIKEGCCVHLLGEEIVKDGENPVEGSGNVSTVRYVRLQTMSKSKES